MPILADITELERRVTEVLAAVAAGLDPTRKSFSDSAVRAAMEILDNRTWDELAKLTGSDLEELVGDALDGAFAQLDENLKREIAGRVRELVERTEAFYRTYAGGVDLPRVREALRRSEETQRLTDALETSMNLRQTELVADTVEVVREAMLNRNMSRSAIIEALQERSEVSTRHLATQAETAIGTYNQLYRNELGREAQLEHFLYFGTLQANSRAFCRVHIDRVFSNEQIEKMNNGMLNPVRDFRGGWRCRHSWLPVDPEWDEELQTRTVDAESAEVCLDRACNRKITVVAPPVRVKRLERQIVLTRQGFIQFFDGETSDSGFVAVHQKWFDARLSARVGSKRRKQFDDELSEARLRADQDEEVLLKPGAPRGTAVSGALSGPKSGRVRRALDNAVSAIDSVHGDGKLPTIPVTSWTSKRHLGVYERVRSTDEPVQIQLAKSPHPELTLIHEIGHFLDHRGLPGASMATNDTGSAALKHWWKAVTSSEAYARIEATRANGGVIPGSGIRFPPNRLNYLDYLLSPVELWARSYSQYIAVRSGDQALRSQVDSIRQNRVSAFTQWTDDDFEDIANAIDNLFEDLGWTTKR